MTELLTDKIVPLFRSELACGQHPFTISAPDLTSSSFDLCAGSKRMSGLPRTAVSARPIRRRTTTSARRPRRRLQSSTPPGCRGRMRDSTSRQWVRDRSSTIARTMTEPVRGLESRACLGRLRLHFASAWSEVSAAFLSLLRLDTVKLSTSFYLQLATFRSSAR
jgi:hypothetical protein